MIGKPLKKSCLTLIKEKNLSTAWKTNLLKSFIRNLQCAKFKIITSKPYLFPIL